MEPHPPDPDRPRLTVVLPAYGEEHRIADTIRRVRDSVGTFADTEIVVVDDGSPDRTADAARDAGADQVLRLPRNQGKGAAVRSGMLAAKGSTVTFTDADLAYSPAQLVTLLDHVENGWDVVVGNRHSRTTAGPPGVRDVGHLAFNAITRTVLDRRFADTQCGFKGFHRSAAQRLFSVSRIDRFAFDVELLWLAGHFGMAITEVPVVLDRAEGSTVRLSIDALRMMRDLLRIRRWAAKGAYGPPG